MGVDGEGLEERRIELRQLQERLAHQHQERIAVNDKWHRLAQLKPRFLSTAAHELRTPLTTIVGYLEMLLDEEFGPLTDDQREPLEVMSESAQSLRAVINDLLSVLRLDQG